MTYEAMKELLGISELYTVTRERIEQELETVLSMVDEGQSPILITDDGKPDEDASASYSPGEQLWGYPHILEYRQPYHFNRMYEVEKTYETEDSLLYDLAHYDGSIELTTWLDDLFGDG